MTSTRSIVVSDAVIRSLGFGLQGHVRRRGWRELWGFECGRRRHSRRRGRDFRLGVGLGQIEPLGRGGAADATCGAVPRGPPTPPPNPAEGIRDARGMSASPTARPGSGCEGGRPPPRRASQEILGSPARGSSRGQAPRFLDLVGGQSLAEPDARREQHILRPESQGR